MNEKMNENDRDKKYDDAVNGLIKDGELTPVGYEDVVPLFRATDIRMINRMVVDYMGLGPKQQAVKR